MKTASNFTYIGRREIQRIEALTRREFMSSVLAAALLIACGDDDEEPDPTATSSSSRRFPVTIEHRWGSTTIDAEPQRVVTVGYSDHDILLALGVMPAALRDWYSDFPNGVWPWAQDKLSDDAPAVLRGELDIEAIAALSPDLILGLYTGMSEEEYRLLSQIAPTVAQSADHENYQTPWPEMTGTSGRALGLPEEAEELIRGIKATIKAARDTNPSFVGAGLAYAGIYGEGQLYVESSESTRAGLFHALGFVTPPEIDALAGDTFVIDISLEQMSLLDQDVLLWELGAADFTRDFVQDLDLYQSLTAVQEGRDVFVGDKLLAGALAHSTVLSLPYALERLVPMLAAAVDGDPTTRGE